MQILIQGLIKNLNFWSALSGLAGAVLIFFFGLPPKIDLEGHQHLILEQTGEGEKKKAKVYKKISYSGVLLLIISFLIQVVLSVN